MKFLKAWLIVIFALASLPIAVAANRATPTREFNLARDYVLAACLIERYRGEPLDAEAQMWASGLVEAGSLSIDAYSALAKLAKKAPPPSIEPNGVKVYIKGCMDFIHAPAFQLQLNKTLAPFIRQ